MTAEEKQIRSEQKRIAREQRKRDKYYANREERIKKSLEYIQRTPEQQKQYQNNRDKVIKNKRKLLNWIKEVLKQEFYKTHGDLKKKFDKIKREIDYKENKEYYNKKQRESVARRRKEDPLFKLKENTRNLIASSFRNKGIRKQSKTFTMLGCSAEKFKQHIENQFDSNMSWDNYGSYWSIDHIIPVATATNENDLLKINHYSNLRPLEKIENIKKGAKLVEKRFF